MCGLPGTGKDTWIREHYPGLPVVSLDEIRREMKISPAESQGPVAAEARERARAYLRARQPFVWNATSLTPELRRKNTELFEAYKASVRIVFLETGWKRRPAAQPGEGTCRLFPNGAGGQYREDAGEADAAGAPGGAAGRVEKYLTSLDFLT